MCLPRTLWWINVDPLDCFVVLVFHVLHFLVMLRPLQGFLELPAKRLISFSVSFWMDYFACVQPCLTGTELKCAFCIVVSHWGRCESSAERLVSSVSQDVSVGSLPSQRDFSELCALSYQWLFTEQGRRHRDVPMAKLWSFTKRV